MAASIIIRAPSVPIDAETFNCARQRRFIWLVVNQVNPEPVQDTDGSSIDTTITPPETIPPDLTDDNDGPSRCVSYLSSCLIPNPGSTFIIRSVSSRNITTLLKEQVVLSPPGSHGSPHRECVETDGWLGFRNIALYGFLGRNDQ